MAIMTKAQHKRHEKLRANVDKACNQVYAAGPNRETVFSKCLELASEATRQAWQAARVELSDFESQMIAEGRAWRASFGMFTANWR
ncbi:MAG: hypothetical protein E5V40_04295 [Mesorhizobium sp.]|nr:MAG: hypothetical protein E5V40_04295 [Mesorhizobium sp.]